MKKSIYRLLLVLLVLIIAIWNQPSCSPGGSPSEEGYGAPDAPSNLTVKLGSIILEWQDNSDSENGFRIERKIGITGNYKQIASVDKNVDSYTDHYNLQEGVPVFYRVYAYNSYGKSEYSNEASIATTLWTGMMDLKVSGNYAYCSFKNGLIILDISDPSNSVKLGGIFGGLGGSGGGIDLKDNFVYLAFEKKGLLIVDVSDPSNPTIASSYDTEGEASDVFVKDNYAYVADGFKGLDIIDITNPADPQFVSSFDTPGKSNGIFVKDNYAFIADGSSGLQIIDITDKAHPSLKGSFDTPGTSDDPIENYYLGALDVFVNGDYAYIANDASGLYIVNVTNASNPTFVAKQPSGERTRGVFVSGNYAYMADFWWGDLQIVNISNPAAPLKVAQYNSLGYYLKVFVVGNLAYVATDNAGLEIVNGATPSSPQHAGAYVESDVIYDIAIDGDYLYATSNWLGMNIVDIQKPLQPKRVGSTTLPSAALEVFAQGNFAYFADAYDGLQIVNVENPYSPFVVGEYTSAYGQSIFVRDNYAFLGTDWSLDIINVTDKSNPYQVGRCSAGDRVYRITLVNNYAYLATWSGLRIVDISNYSSPKLVGSYNYKDSQANGIFVRDNYAYLADHYEGLLIFDVSIPSLPRLEGKLNLNPA